MTKPKRRIMTKAKLNEISLVDRPAQIGARVVLRKRNDVEKKYPLEQPVLLSDVDGHSHILDLADGAGGDTSYSHSEDADHGHTHPWVKGDDGKVLIGASDGHTHNILPQGDAGPLTKGSVPAVPPAADGGNQEIVMTPEEKAALEKAAQEKLDAMEKRAQRAERLAELSDDQKALFVKMEQKDQDAFLALKPEERQAQVRKSQDADPVVYTALDGAEFRKSDNQRLVALAKRADETEKALRASESLAKRHSLEKRADELLKNLKGSTDDKVLLLEVLESIPTEKRGSVEEILKAADSAMGLTLKQLGTNGDPESATGEQELAEIAKRIQTENPKLSDAQAMAKAVRTPEGRLAYSKHVGA